MASPHNPESWREKRRQESRTEARLRQVRPSLRGDGQALSRPGTPDRPQPKLPPLASAAHSAPRSPLPMPNLRVRPSGTMPLPARAAMRAGPPLERALSRPTVAPGQRPSPRIVQKPETKPLVVRTKRPMHAAGSKTIATQDRPKPPRPTVAPSQRPPPRIVQKPETKPLVARTKRLPQAAGPKMIGTQDRPKPPRPNRPALGPANLHATIARPLSPPQPHKPRPDLSRRHTGVTTTPPLPRAGGTPRPRDLQPVRDNQPPPVRRTGRVGALAKPRVREGELSAHLPWLRAAGPTLETASGRRVILHGLTEVLPATGSALALLHRAALGGDEGNASIWLDLAAGTDHLGGALDDVIAHHAAHGVYTILHGGPTHRAAHRYADEPAVLFSLPTAPDECVTATLDGVRAAHPRAVVLIPAGTAQDAHHRPGAVLRWDLGEVGGGAMAAVERMHHCPVMLVWHPARGSPMANERIIQAAGRGGIGWIAHDPEPWMQHRYGVPELSRAAHAVLRGLILSDHFATPHAA